MDRGWAKGRRRLLWGLLSVLTVAVLGVVILRVRPVLRPEPAVLAPLDPACDLAAGPCTARFPNGERLTLEVLPRGIPPLTPLTLELSAQGLPVGSAQVDFAGVDMDMGFNRPTLVAVAPGLLRGQGMLPICVRDRMVWEARVLIEGPEGLMAAPFRFETFRGR